MSYISNLNIIADLELDGTDDAMLHELLQCYMSTRQMVKIDILNIITCKVLFEFMGIDTQGIIDIPLISPEFVKEFIDKNQELLLNYFIFISSLIGYAEKILYDNNHINVPPSFTGSVVKVDWVGFNVVHLFKIPPFFEIFFSLEGVDYPSYISLSNLNNVVSVVMSCFIISTTSLVVRIGYLTFFIPVINWQQS